MAGDQQHPENQPEQADEHMADQTPAPEATDVDPAQTVPGLDDEDHDLTRERVQQLEGEADHAKEQALRAAAEVANIRRRAEKDVENARRYALEKFSQDLLPVIDNLERALESSDTEAEGVKTLAEGVELTLKNFIDVLARFNVVQVNPVGEPFDPQLHEAMSMIENADVEPNTVLTVVQKGYTLNGRLVRAAMVVVSR